MSTMRTRLGAIWKTEMSNNKKHLFIDTRYKLQHG